MVLTPESGVSALPGVGPKRAAILREAGFERLQDLLGHLPRHYEDRRHISTTAAVSEAGTYTLCGRLRGARRIFTRRRGLSIVRARLEDADGELAVVWFNQPYLAAQLDSDKRYLLHGEVKARAKALELVNPSRTEVGTAGLESEIVPIYPRIGELGPAFVARLMAALVTEVDFDAIEDPLPLEVLEAYDLPPLALAVRSLHRPDGSSALDELRGGTSPAHNRLIYGELLKLRLRIETARAARAAVERPHRYRVDARVLDKLRAALPFSLTAAQERAIGQIAADLDASTPMRRLLHGDVGSGKTAVAAVALGLAIESGLQGALMVPTELLAEQHAKNLRGLLPASCRIGLFTSSSDSDRQALSRGDLDVAVGTQALIQAAVSFRNLGLAVVDEQHRFGVDQRRRLVAKGRATDLLVMTATPIPRSLALTVYGDLDLSVVDELPPGRQLPQTLLLPRSRRRAVYTALRRRLLRGGQAYIVLPFIESSCELDVASLEKEGREVVELLDGCRCAVVSGSMAQSEREAVMGQFSSGHLDALIATTVIEVGVDVPAARFMIIENAERFGLAQLHQLRGRVSRGSETCYCVALHGRLNDDAGRRLEAFSRCRDGFEIADADLELRGPGDLVGTRQSGDLALSAARLPRDIQWLERACRDAQRALMPAGG